MVVVESTPRPPPIPVPLPLPSLLPNGIVTAKEWFKYVQAPSEYVTTTADCDDEILFSSNHIIDEDPFDGKDSSRTSLASTSISTSTSTSTSTTTLASITHESMNTDLISSKNSALVKTTEAELKIVIGTETEMTNMDTVKSGDNRNRVIQINEYDKSGNSYQGGGHEDVGGDEKGGRAGVEDEEEGEEAGEGGAGAGGIKSTNGFLPTHMGMGRDVGRGMGSSSHNANASAKPFLSDINKKSCELLLMKQIHANGENQINSENTDYVHEKSAFSVVNENFADRKVSNSVMPAMACHAMP